MWQSKPYVKMKCPDCGAKMVEKYTPTMGSFYGCTRWPNCRGFHSIHQVGVKAGQPMGTPADSTTRQWRQKAHEAFDSLWGGVEPFMDRNDAYDLMSVILNIHPKLCHIGSFDIPMCKKLIEETDKQIVLLKSERKQKELNII